MVLKREIVFFALITLFGLAVSLFAYILGHSDSLTLIIRLLALNGYHRPKHRRHNDAFYKRNNAFLQKILHQNTPLFCGSRAAPNNLASYRRLYPSFRPYCVLPNFLSLYLFFFFGGINSLNSDLRGFCSRVSSKKNHGLLASPSHAHVCSIVHWNSACQSERH